MFERLTSPAGDRPTFRFNRAVARRSAIFIACATVVVAAKLIFAPDWRPGPYAQRLISVVTAVGIFALVRWIVQPGLSRRS